MFAGLITYGASKATLEALTRSIAMEVGKYGITVNSVAPGPTQTGWIDEELGKAVLPLIPMGELIQPEDIANTIVFSQFLPKSPPAKGKGQGFEPLTWGFW